MFRRRLSGVEQAAKTEGSFEGGAGGNPVNYQGASYSGNSSSARTGYKVVKVGIGVGGYLAIGPRDSRSADRI